MQFPWRGAECRVGVFGSMLRDVGEVGVSRGTQRVVRSSTKPTGFRFCTEVQFPEPVRKWRRYPPPPEASEQERRIYGAAFMPHFQKGE